MHFVKVIAVDNINITGKVLAAHTEYINPDSVCCMHVPNEMYGIKIPAGIRDGFTEVRLVNGSTVFLHESPAEARGIFTFGEKDA